MTEKPKLEKIFLNGMDSWFSNFFIETFRTDHLPDSKLQTQFMGTLNDKKKRQLPMYFQPKIISFDYNTSYKSDIFSNDIIVYNLNTGNIKEIEYIINGLKAIKFDSEKILIIISNILTWAKTPDKIQSDDPDEIVFNYPEEIKPEQKSEIKDNESEKQENQENNTKSMIGEQNKTNEENKENKNENVENEANISKVDQTKSDLSKRMSNKSLGEESKHVIVYYTEKDYLKRKPHHKYIQFKYVENEALLLNQKSNVKAYVICPGIIYGYGEKTFYSIFRNALLNLPVEEILLEKGKNIIPTLHMKDLINIITKIIEKKPNSYYILAFDQSENRTLKNIIKSIYDCIGDSNNMMPIKNEEPLEDKNENKEENIEHEEKDISPNEIKVENDNEGNNNEEKNDNMNEEKKNEEQIQYKKRSSVFDKKYIVSKYFPKVLLTLDVKILPSEFLKGEPKKPFYHNDSDDEDKEKEQQKIIEYIPLFKWHAPQGINSNSQSIRKEFIRYRNLNANKVLVLGNPYTGKTELGTILSKIFHLPIINAKMIVEFGKKFANIDSNTNTINETNENENKGTQRKNSIERDLIRDIQKTMKELEEGRAIAEENYNKRKDKKKTDPPFDDKMYYRFNDEMMVRILKRRLQENDASVYGFILDGFPKNHQQAEDLFEDMDKGGIVPNSIIIFDNAEDDYLINRIKNNENFPKDPKDPQASIILERAHRRLNKVKENKTHEGYVDLINFFKDEKFDKNKLLIIDPKKEIIDLVKETQEFIKINNDNKINQIDEKLECTDYQYDYIKEQEMKNQKEEENVENDMNKQDKDNKIVEEKEIHEEKIEEKKEEEEEKPKDEIKKDDENNETKKENEIEEEKKEPEIIKTPYELEKENEFQLLEKKSEVLRRYLAENVLPLLSLGILHVANERPDDPVEALADYLLSKSFEIEKEEKERKNKNNKDNKNADEKNNENNNNEQIDLNNN